MSASLVAWWPWIEALGWTLLHFVWQGLVIGAGFAAARALLAKERCDARYATGLAALAFGVPLGIVLGRVSWNVLADNLGTVAEPITAVVVVLLSIPVVLALVNLIAYIPGRMAARLRPAVILRSE